MLILLELGKQKISFNNRYPLFIHLPIFHVKKMFYGIVTSILIACVWTISSITNAASFFYIRKKYDYRGKSIYFILMLESGFVSMCSITATGLYIYLAVVSECQSGSCCTFLSFQQVIPLGQSLVNFTISLLR